jgi:hypothetical protein
MLRLNHKTDVRPYYIFQAFESITFIATLNLKLQYLRFQ